MTFDLANPVIFPEQTAKVPAILLKLVCDPICVVAAFRATVAAAEALVFDLFAEPSRDAPVVVGLGGVETSR